MNGDRHFKERKKTPETQVFRRRDGTPDPGNGGVGVKGLSSETRTRSIGKF